MDELHPGYLVGLLVLLVACSAFFSCVETALLNLDRYRLRLQAKQGLRGARRSSWLLLHDDRLRGTLLFGRTLVNVSAAALASWAALRHWGVIGLAVAIPGMTLLLLLFGALLPRRYGALRSERVALPLSLPLLILQRLCWPLLWLLTLLSNALLRLLGVAAAEQDDSGRSRDEEALHPADNPQASEVNRHDMLLGLLDLEKVTVNDLMIPRNEIEGIDLDDELEVIVEQLRTTSHTRLPVYRDDVNQIEGVVHMRQIARLLTQGRLTKENLRQACMEPYFVPESTPLSTQLVNFQKEKRRIGVVVDEYGEVIGIVTLEDILEEIVGDFNDLDSLDNPDIQAQEDGSFVIDGSANLRELNKSLGWQLPCDGPKTLNGLVTEALEQIPDCAVCLRIGPYCLEIQQSAENRVKSVRAWHPRALTPLVESDTSV
ncbi:HlyC/CorC family transporter [Pseudomonas aeruginosa]|uniref:HlyC/CorC family transporter n=3 Tax=Pseudomonas aeruginosa TaxID=287 RepID=UPI00053B41EF|nr:HlyC/CorC family transporter [Pseudomonas aeruginosa]KSM75836.1 magnesium/cobalt efflux protein [Pseudomonas aeruginosa]KSO21345.1 magnesium/cobalt efflux protein [Pseudomonas aeruginosa]MBA5124678.1 HlyC/CorC family transporter [Pseudomonas aeruginosa]MBA5378277.1 HlyC/CorC family transporter [Pseudomonas aeruginosa]MBN0428241.1 HlyC/CorC family transporter [Pseudomonas aeruginosa]